MIKVGIVGATGYTGVELLRLLVAHPQVEITAITSRSEAGGAVAELFPSLRGRLNLRFVEPDPVVLQSCALLFYATPNGTAMSQVPALLAAGVRVIDLAADFRLRDAAEWERWYKMPHACPELLKDAVYGLPEMNRARLREARLVANPGCYATAVQLGFLPLVEAGVIDPNRLIADCKSGVSGAGRKAEVGMLFCEAGDNFKAYNVAGHRHVPEICQGLTAATGKTVDLTFVPHLTPMIRGIHATLYGLVIDASVDVQALYEHHYRNEPFVDVLPPGSHPDTRSVRGANVCRIAVHKPRSGEVVIVLAVIDNLVKGAAGQAVQNMNLMFGLPESMGLEAAALLP
ncbi:MAG: N-acetyl-gamma-glutamyl-phosphate reductase [Gammaproteobacteria bacterium]